MASGNGAQPPGFAGTVERQGPPGPPGGGVDGFARAAATGTSTRRTDTPVPRLGRLSVPARGRGRRRRFRAGWRHPPRRRRRARPRRLRRSLRRRRGPGARRSRRARQRRRADLQPRLGAATAEAGVPGVLPDRGCLTDCRHVAVGGRRAMSPRRPGRPAAPAHAARGAPGQRRPVLGGGLRDERADAGDRRARRPRCHPRHRRPARARPPARPSACSAPSP